MRLTSLAAAAALLLACAGPARAQLFDAPFSEAPLFPAVEAAGPRWSLGAEYLIWWLRRGQAPPILTTGPDASQGVLGQPGTRVVFGDGRLETRHDDRFIGARVSVDWLNADRSFGLEGRAFFLERDSTYFTLKHRPTPLLALPYTDARTGRPASEIVAGPDPARGALNGGFVGYSRIELFGQEANAVVPLLDDEAWTVDLLAGARFLQMRDRFHQTATSFVLPEQSDLFGVKDNFRIHNAFYGGQLGARLERRFGRLAVQSRFTAALGADDQLIRTFGQRVTATPQIRVETPGGLYVQPSNSGRFERCNFDAVGEVGVNLAYDLRPRVRLIAGYTFLLWADPLRAGDQVDTVVNPQAGTAPARPVIPFKGDVFWAQGASVGLQLRW
jgi:hypothetical protein